MLETDYFVGHDVQPVLMEKLLIAAPNSHSGILLF